MSRFGQGDADRLLSFRRFFYAGEADHFAGKEPTDEKT
jgi:hypothetical protein